MFIFVDAAINATAPIKAPIKRTISTGDAAAKTQILQVAANPNSAAPDAKRVKLEAGQGTSAQASGDDGSAQ